MGRDGNPIRPPLAVSRGSRFGGVSGANPPPSSFPPNVSGAKASIAGDFAGNQYFAASVLWPSFAAWTTAIGGTFSRASSATYLDGGVVKTATANTPRFPTSLAGVAQGLRLTGAATNIQPQSSDFSQTTPWQLQSVSSVAGQSDPAGGNTATKVVPAAGSHTNPGLYDNFNPGFTATNWTISAFVKNAGYNFFVIDINNVDQQQVCVDLTTGVVITLGTVTAAGAIALAGGWWFVYLTAVPAFAGNNPPSFRVSDHSGTGSILVNADGVSGVGMWGVQITNTAFPVDYIPTTTVSVTQAADSFSFPYTQTTYSALAYLNGQIAPTGVLIGDGAATAALVTGTTHFDTLNATNLAGPAFVGVLGVAHKAMAAGSPAGRSVTSDGAAPTSDANGFAPAAPTTIALGAFTGGAQPSFANFSQIALWNSLVASAAEMQRLTT